MSIFTKIRLPRVKRNRFNLTHRVAMSLDWGVLAPFVCIECVPNDKFRMTSQILTRLAPMLAPVYGRINVRTDFFFVPMRLLWSEWENFITGGPDGNSSPVLPYFSLNGQADTTSGRQNVGTLWDYFGLPVRNADVDMNLKSRSGMVCSLPFRAYRKIWNDYYRDENLQDEKDISFDVSGSETDYTLLDIEHRAWRKDYFTSALPWLQRGQEAVVGLQGKPFAFDDSGEVPSWLYNYEKGGLLPGHQLLWDTSGNPIELNNPSSSASAANSTNYLVMSDQDGYISFYGQGGEPIISQTAVNPNTLYYVSGASVTPMSQRVGFKNTSNIGQQSLDVTPVGGIAGRADGSGDNPLAKGPYYISGSDLNQIIADAGGNQFISINELRRSNAVQIWLERNARAGYRYTEQILSHYGARVPDYRLQRAEYLGGGTTPVSISEINQTSATVTVDNEESPLADMAGHGLSFGLNKTRGYRCQEHGYIIGIVSIVPEAVYSQGIQPMWERRDRFDFYFPEFAHLGEQPIYQSELFGYGGQGEETPVFGYTPRYAEYKYIPSRIAGDFRTSLEHWTLSRKFANAPTLSEDFIKIDGQANDLNRIFAVETDSQGQPVDHFLLYVNNIIQARRPMPRFGTPRL